MRNLNRITNYYNKIEAWKDWNHLAFEVGKAGYPDLVQKYYPGEDAGWRKIDNRTAKLRAEFQAILNTQEHGG